MTTNTDTPRTGTPDLEDEKLDQELKKFLADIMMVNESTKLLPLSDHYFNLYNFLIARENEFIGKDYEHLYWYQKSYHLFHMAQFELLVKNNLAAAKDYMFECIQASQKSQNGEWHAYMLATLHYLNNRPDGMRQVMDIIKVNHAIVQLLLDGLEFRGGPDYRQDYKAEKDHSLKLYLRDKKQQPL